MQFTKRAKIPNNSRLEQQLLLLLLLPLALRAQLLAQVDERVPPYHKKNSWLSNRQHRLLPQRPLQKKQLLNRLH